MVAGDINIITREPGEHLKGYIPGSPGTYHAVGLEGAVGGPLSSTLSSRIAFPTSDRGGYGTNLTTGEPVGDEHNRSIRGKLRFEPSSSVKIDLESDYSKIDDHAGGIRYAGRGNFSVVPTAIALFGPAAVGFESLPEEVNGNSEMTSIRSGHWNFAIPRLPRKSPSSVTVGAAVPEYGMMKAQSRCP